LAQVFQVELRRQLGGTHEVAEHHGELAALGSGILLDGGRRDSLAQPGRRGPVGLTLDRIGAPGTAVGGRWKRCRTLNAGDRELGTALCAELRLGWVLVFAPRTVHTGPPGAGRSRRRAEGRRPLWPKISGRVPSRGGRPARLWLVA